MNMTLNHKMEYALMFIASSGLAITLIYNVMDIVDVDRTCVCTYLYSKLKMKFIELTFSPSRSIFITITIDPHMHCVKSFQQSRLSCLG